MMTPPLVQEPFPHPHRIGKDQFVFVVCQHGAEAVLKKHWLGDQRPFRLAFSRPGLLTFKVDSEETQLPEHWLIRQSGLALGRVRGNQAEQLVAEALALAGSQWDAVHVFHRDLGLPGIRGFEPGPTPLTDEIAALFQSQLQSAEEASGVGAAGGLTARVFNQECPPGSRVLDIVLIENDQWLVGHHVARKRHQCWPGGAYRVAAPREMISRAYRKMAEAIAWSGLPLQSGDEIVELGSAPGGASQRLLDLGLHVTGVDPAEMHPLLLQHERFEHWRSKVAGVRRKRFSKFRWLAADASVVPAYTLDMVEDVVNYPTSRFEGLLLTFKFSSYDLAEHLDADLARVAGWGFDRVEARQLASNRQECCVVAQRPADWKAPSRAALMQQISRSNADKRRSRTAKKRSERGGDEQPE